MLILPLFATYLQSNKNEYTEMFHNDNTEYDKNGEPIQINTYKYDIISILYLFMRGYNANHYYRWGVIDNICVVLLYILAFIISSLAAYLSFTCTWKGVVSNIMFRIFFAIIAFLLGPFYFVWFFLVNYLGDMC
jgi:hypothetical protein